MKIILDNLQTVVLILSLVVTVIIYYKNKSDDRKARATMLYFQIKEIEKNMDYIKEYCAKDNFTQLGEFHKSKLVYNKNLWDENKIYLSRKINNDNYDNIEKFYSDATDMLNEQLLVKRLFLNSIENRQRISEEKQYEANVSNLTDEEDRAATIAKKRDEIAAAINLGTSAYVPNITNEIITRNISQFKQLTNTIAFENLKKIAKIK